MLDLAPDIEKTVRDYAKREGLSESDYIARLVKNAALQATLAPQATLVPTPKDAQVPDARAAWQKRIDASDDEKRAKVLEYISLSKEEAILRHAPSIAWLDAQLAEAENATPEEIAEAEAEWADFKHSMNETRRADGERLLYPEETGL